MLHHRVGQHGAAQAHAHVGESLARALRDVRSLRRLEALRSQLPPAGNPVSQGAGDLSPRERAMLQRLATGATNGHIAQELAYSVSTIRNDTMANYRKLAVTGRPEAVAGAVVLGLLP